MTFEHICLFYQKSNLWDQLRPILTTPYLYICDEHKTAVVRAQVGGEGMVINSAELPYLASPVRIPLLIDALTERINTLLEMWGDLTLCVEMSWAIRTPAGAVYLREYEAAIEALCAERSIQAVCLYNEQIMLDRQLLIGLHTHRAVVSADGITQNPYFVPPAIYTSRSQRQQFNYWLAQINPSAPAATTTPAPVSIYDREETPQLVAQENEEVRWKIRCFGGLRVYRADGTLIQWNAISGATRMTKTLFAFLLFRGESGATGEELADLLWPEADNGKQSMNRLYHTVRCLRKALSPNLPPRTPSPFVLRQDQRYFLALPSHSWLDLPMFQELCHRGQTHFQQESWQEALLCWQSAERLYTGDLLADIPEKYAANRERDWCWSRRFWYRSMYVKLLIGLAAIERRNHNIPTALAYCDKALQNDPTNEAAHSEKLRTLAAVNRIDALKRQYRLYRNALVEFEMGVPSAEFEQLYASLHNG